MRDHHAAQHHSRRETSCLRREGSLEPGKKCGLCYYGKEEGCPGPFSTVIHQSQLSNQVQGTSQQFSPVVQFSAAVTLITTLGSYHPSPQKVSHCPVHSQTPMLTTLTGQQAVTLHNSATARSLNKDIGTLEAVTSNGLVSNPFQSSLDTVCRHHFQLSNQKALV